MAVKKESGEMGCSNALNVKGVMKMNIIDWLKWKCYKKVIDKIRVSFTVCTVDNYIIINHINIAKQKDLKFEFDKDDFFKKDEKKIRKLARKYLKNARKSKYIETNGGIISSGKHAKLCFWNIKAEYRNITYDEYLELEGKAIL